MMKQKIAIARGVMAFRYAVRRVKIY